MSSSVLAAEAIKKISFGRERVKLGYDDIGVKISGYKDVDINGKVLKNVSTKVKISAKNPKHNNSEC